MPICGQSSEGRLADRLLPRVNAFGCIRIMWRMRFDPRVNQTWLAAGWRLLLLACCALVFLFALHAKVSVYHPGGHLSSATASKLWLNAQKPLPPPLSPSVAFLWFAALLVYFLCQHCDLRWNGGYRAPAPAQRTQLYLHRFLRPPPAR